MLLHLKIIAPSNIIFEGEALFVTLPGTEGELTVLPGHTIFVSTLKPGTIRYCRQDSSGNKTISSHQVERGVVEVEHNNVTVLV